MSRHALKVELRRVRNAAHQPRPTRRLDPPQPQPLTGRQHNLHIGPGKLMVTVLTPLKHGIQMLPLAVNIHRDPEATLFHPTQTGPQAESKPADSSAHGRRSIRSCHASCNTVL